MEQIVAIELAIFDFGGVVAEEGFREGLFAIAEKNGLRPQAFFQDVCDLILSSGYLTGKASEQKFWDAVRAHSGITAPDDSLRKEILSRFVIRQWMLDLIRGLRSRQVRTAMLSDQTNWLDELNAENEFFSLFEKVFNSYHTHKSKHDDSVFDDVLKAMRVSPARALFIDDNEGHIDRAKARGLNTILYTGRENFEQNMAKIFPLLEN